MTDEIENRIIDLEHELTVLKSGKIAETLKKEIAFRHAIEKSIPSGIAVIDDTGKQVYVNRSFCNLVGWTENELLDKYPPYIYWHKPEIENINNAFQQTLDNNAPKDGFDLVFCNKSEKLIPVNVVISPFFQENNKTFWLANVVDITERKKTEQALRESEEKYKLLFNNSGDPILIHDNCGKILSVNQTACVEYGYTNDEFVLLKIHEIDTPEQSVYANERISQLMQNGFAFFETIHKRNDCSCLFVDVNARKIIFNGQNAMMSVCRNITERKQAELIINQQNDKLKKLNADKDRFITILAHDLKSPFNSILGFLNLLTKNIRKYDIDKIEKQIHIINNSAQNTFRLLEDILLWARAQSGKILFEPQKIDFNEICTEIIGNLINYAGEKSIKIDCFEPEKTILNADLNMFKTILRNLISNAIKFTNEKGQIKIYTEKNHLNAIITVSDNGIGIDKDNQIKLWDLSQQFTTQGTADEKGTGLGLLLCKDFVEKHGGEIWVESVFGKGSNFKFTIPLCND